MLRRKKTKIASLLLIVLMIILMFAPVSLYDVGVYRHCPIINRLTYNFFHANGVHLALNAWCFLSCIFLADVPASVLIASFIIACTVPVYSDIPTIGLSGVCFALLGFIMLKVKNKVNYNIYIAISIILPTVLLDSVNNLVHAYCYIVAVIVGLIFKAKHGKGS